MSFEVSFFANRAAATLPNRLEGVFEYELVRGPTAGNYTLLGQLT